MTDHIVILTGAGISAESGLATFRDAGGLWARNRIEDVATPQAFARDPARVLAFYDQRRAQAVDAQPNAAHDALARLTAALAERVTLVTQNVDGLHRKAGANAIEMHGALDRALCAACGHRWPAPERMAPSDACPACAKPTARPDIVWFGEFPYDMDEIEHRLAKCTLFAAIGTSGQVYPAAGFIDIAARAGASTIEFNLEPTDLTRFFDRFVPGPASRTVPGWVAQLLGRP